MPDLREVSDSAIAGLRRLMADLRPAQLDDLGLLPTLRWYIGQYDGRHPELTVALNAERCPSVCRRNTRQCSFEPFKRHRLTSPGTHKRLRPRSSFARKPTACG